MSIQYIKHNQYPNSILIRNFIGPVYVQDIMDSWDYLIDNKLITGDLKGVINRITECELKMDLNGFKILIAYLKKIKIFRDLKLAVICKNPETIVFPMLAEHAEKELQIKPFSMEDAAVDWIMETANNKSNLDKTTTDHI